MQEVINMKLLLKAQDIRVEFTGRDVLDIDELEIFDYDRIGLVGANGAGKKGFCSYGKIEYKTVSTTTYEWWGRNKT